jgi:hypothetical protein
MHSEKMSGRNILMIEVDVLHHSLSYEETRVWDATTISRVYGS